MSGKMLGIDIGSRTVRFVIVKGGKPVRYIEEELPEFMVKNSQIVAFNAMAEFLRGVRRKDKIRVRDAAVTLSEESCVIRRIRLPKMNIAQLKINLPYEFHDYIQGDPSEYVFDYAVIRMDDSSMELMACAASRKLIDRYKTMLKRAGFRLARLVPEELAFQNIVMPPAEIKKNLTERERIDRMCRKEEAEQALKAKKDEKKAGRPEKLPAHLTNEELAVKAAQEALRNGFTFDKSTVLSGNEPAGVSVQGGGGFGLQSSGQGPYPAQGTGYGPDQARGQAQQPQTSYLARLQVLNAGNPDGTDSGAGSEAAGQTLSAAGFGSGTAGQTLSAAGFGSGTAAQASSAAGFGSGTAAQASSADAFGSGAGFGSPAQETAQPQSEQQKREEELKKLEGKDYAILDFGAGRTKLHFFSKGSYEITRTMETSAEAIVSTVAQARGIEPHIARIMLEHDQDQIAESPEVQREFDTMATEIMRVLNFYNYNNPQNTLEKIHYCGMEVIADRMKDRIRSLTQMDVVPLTDMIEGGNEIEGLLRGPQAYGVAVV